MWQILTQGNGEGRPIQKTCNRKTFASKRGVALGLGLAADLTWYVCDRVTDSSSQLTQHPRCRLHLLPCRCIALANYPNVIRIRSTLKVPTLIISCWVLATPLLSARQCAGFNGSQHCP